jgi:3-hydroxyacyl-CoA dehydrogenase
MAAVRMYEEGFATREDIDDGMRLGSGHPMGPLTLCDFIGLDVLYAVCDSLYDEFKRPEYAPPRCSSAWWCRATTAERAAAASMTTTRPRSRRRRL